MPHAQAKSGTSASPASLETLLDKLADFNLEGVSGTQLEADGFLHFAVEHGAEQDVHTALADYHPKWTTDLYTETLGIQELGVRGVLLGIVQRARQSALAAGRPIDTVLTGVDPNNPSTFYVQITFVGSDWSSEPPN